MKNKQIKSTVHDANKKSEINKLCVNKQRQSMKIKSIFRNAPSRTTRSSTIIAINTTAVTFATTNAPSRTTRSTTIIAINTTAVTFATTNALGRTTRSSTIIAINTTTATSATTILRVGLLDQVLLLLSILLLLHLLLLML